MEIKTKYEIGQHIWVVCVERKWLTVYDTYINSIELSKDGYCYYGQDCEDYTEEQIIPYAETDKLADKIKELMQQIHEREEKE